MSRDDRIRARRRIDRIILALTLAVGALLVSLAGFAIGQLINDNSAPPVPSPTVVATQPGTEAAESTVFPIPNTSAGGTVVPTSVAADIPATMLSPTEVPLLFFEGPFTYGHSFEGRPLWAYRLGTGPSARALIGGIHGGYERNTTELVSETLDHLTQQPDLIPADVTLYIIPCANPDGAAAGTDAVHGRTNGRGVDLNRNWRTDPWQMTATHGTRPVSAGRFPFSEPETRALRDFIHGRDIEAAIFYHSAMGKIFSGMAYSQCATFQLAEMMSEVTGYPHAPEGVPGQITTGDAIDYLSTQGITAIEIELTNHQDIDWDPNWVGMLEFLRWTIPIQPEDYFLYTVQEGDTLSQIAIGYRVAVEDILAANNIPDQHFIQQGDVIRIPIVRDE
jgi:hypothetical protein